MKIALSLGADYVAQVITAERVKPKSMVVQFINYVLALTIIKTNLIFFANYHKNNYQNLSHR
jgi:hypothetical protein